MAEGIIVSVRQLAMDLRDMTHPTHEEIMYIIRDKPQTAADRARAVVSDKGEMLTDFGPWPLYIPLAEYKAEQAEALVKARVRDWEALVGKKQR